MSRASPPIATVRSLAPILLLALFCGAAVIFPLTATDTWWHLAAGREILQGGFLYTDPFSVGAAGRPWTDVHWLFQICAYLAHELGGLTALVLGKALLFAAGAAVLHRVAVRGAGSEGWLVVALMAPVLYSARHLVLARPIVFTLLLIALTLYLLERFRRERRARMLLWLLPVQVLWANSQGLFLIGPALVGCYLAGEAVQSGLGRRGFTGFEVEFERRDVVLLAGALGLMLAAGLITPYGFDGLALPLALLGRIDPVHAELYAVNVSENVPPWVLARLDDSGVFWFPWIGAAAFASFLVDLRRISLTRILVLGAMLALALMANRNVLLFCWLAAPIVALNLNGWLRGPEPAGRAARALRIAARHPLPALGVLTLLCLPLGSAWLDEGVLDRPTPFRVPAAGAARLADDAAGGRVFCSVRYGGYLIWRAYPSYRPYIDGRLILRTPAEFASYLDLLDHPETGFDALQQRHGFSYAALPTAAPGRYLGLVRHLYRHPDWCLLHTDGTETLFAASDDGCEEAIDLSTAEQVRAVAGELRARLGGSPRIHARATLHLGRLLAFLGLHDRAAEVLGPSTDPEARALLARSHFLAGRTAEARTLAETLLGESLAEVSSIDLLALIAAEQGQSAEAIRHLRQSLGIAPHDRLAQELLAEMERRVRSSEAP